MPIGFWAINRKDIIQLVDLNYKRLYGKASEHSPAFHTLIDKIVRTLPAALETATEEYVEDGIINTKATKGDF